MLQVRSTQKSSWASKTRWVRLRRSYLHFLASATHVCDATEVDKPLSMWKAPKSEQLRNALWLGNTQVPRLTNKWCAGTVGVTDSHQFFDNISASAVVGDAFRSFKARAGSFSGKVRQIRARGTLPGTFREHCPVLVSNFGERCLAPVPKFSTLSRFWSGEGNQKT